MSDLSAQDYYQEYRKKTLEMGYSPIDRQRFTGIIKTISTLHSTVGYIIKKQVKETDLIKKKVNG